MYENHSAKLVTHPGPYQFKDDKVTLRVNDGPAFDTVLGPDVTDIKQLLEAIRLAAGGIRYLRHAVGTVEIRTLREGTSMSIEVMHITSNASKQLGWQSGDYACGAGGYANRGRATALEIEAAQLTYSTPPKTSS